MRHLPLTGLLLLLLAIVGGSVAFEVASHGSATRERAPALPSDVLVGPRVTLTSLRGTPAVISFWASWCGPCRREAPELERLHRSLGDRAKVVGVNSMDELKAARTFARDHRLTFPSLRDGDGAVGRAYGLVGLPTTIVLDSHGQIASVLNGPQTESSLREALELAG